ncbi:MAG: hypothetical protein KME32_07355 [Mojavia pulchra JT2-VF2]|jgi:hypothetical protein|uniref:Uncharacterized protein n=1 Tax=Mojavia pulchra JT2-VF2 TaxID=287848 RepID=A0A951PW80_9NOST|nr:hypothetical protein [Mojavia pulchra JT2-VF2]
MQSIIHESANFQGNRQGYIKNIFLILLAFASAFYPRIFSAVGAPSLINFIHFIIVPCTLGIVLVSTRTKNRLQIGFTWEIIAGLLFFLGVMLASALLNQAGVINVLLNFILLTEPFMILLAILCLPLSIASWKKLRSFLLISSIINIILAIAQHFLLITGILKYSRYSLADNVQGVFYLSGAGNYVSVSVSLSVAIYYFINAKFSPLWLRIFCIFAAFYQLVVSDSKQILIVFFLAWIILVFTKFNNFRKLLLYLVAIVVVIGGFFWLVLNSNIEALSAFKHWANRTSIYIPPDGEGFQAKIAGIEMIASYFKSPFNWLLGLGPGHTVSRLGGWVFRDYASMVIPLGATTHPVTEQAWTFVNSNWLILESSLFMPLFSWAGIWGDLGFIGLATYVYLGYIVWNRLCWDDFSKFLMLTLFIYGLIITQMEEPGQTMTVAILIGLQWHQRQMSKRSLTHQAYLHNDGNAQIPTHKS